MTTEKLYTIVVEHYKTKRDVEEGKPSRTGESGFKPMPLQDAIVCKSKMSEHPVCGMIRITKLFRFEHMILNYYRCCGSRWQDVSDKACSDTCQDCGRRVSPYNSEKIQD